VPRNLRSSSPMVGLETEVGDYYSAWRLPKPTRCQAIGPKALTRRMQRETTVILKRFSYLLPISLPTANRKAGQSRCAKRKPSNQPIVRTEDI
jgi:hypothetical protein